DPPVDSLLPVPADVVVDVSDQGAAVVSFTLAASDIGLRNVQYSLDNGITWRKAKPATLAEPFTLRQLERGVAYTLLLRSVAPGAASAPSDPVTFTVPFEPVTMEVDGKPLRSGGTVEAGAAVRFLGLPVGASVVMTDRRLEVAVNPTKRARIAKSEPLPPARDFTARVISASGVEVAELSVTTKDAPRFEVSVWPTQANLGSGVPLVLNFTQRVRDKAAMERALKVTSTVDYGRAGWYWVNDKKAVFRPKAFWPGNATVKVSADLSVIRGAEGTWGPDELSSRFKTGDQVILRVNLNSHRMKYIRNGVLERTFKISGGMSGWLTESGTKVLTAHIPHKRLYNPDPENGWDVEVRWAIRVNDNGEYIHDATWNYSIGYANTSHGCTNMTYSDMGWLFANTKFGDVAVYTGSSAPIGTDDYLAGYWNIPWSEWKQGSALSQDS
ncbi:MAG: L,D-transpeptidase, partial [Candidatus Nanopelagicales bacterium]